MLSATDNDLLTQTGPGTPMGDYFRRFWIPVLLSRELPEPDGAPVRVTVMGEELVAFRDTRGPRRAARPPLSAPRRQPLLRPERGVRPQVRLPRLEVRRRRPLPRHADDAAGQRVPRQGARGRPSHARVGRIRVGLSRARRARAGAPRARVRARAARAPLRVEEAPAVQLGPVGRGRDRHGALLVPPHAGDVVGGRERCRHEPILGRSQPDALDAGGRHAALPGGAVRRGPGGRRRAPRRRRRSLLARDPLPPAEPRARAERVRGRELPRPDLGPDRRRLVLGLLLYVESRAAPDRRRAPPARRGAERALRGRRAVRSDPEPRERLPHRPRRSEAARPSRASAASRSRTPPSRTARA